MDSCIEELATLIRERSRKAADNYYSANGGRQTANGMYYRQIEAKAAGILQVLKDYRADHPELYEDTDRLEASHLRGEVSTLKEELIKARRALASYQEREKIQGWAEL